MPATTKAKAKPEPELRWGSYEEAAILGHVSARTIYLWVQKGRIRARRDGAARRKHVCLNDIERLVAEAAAEGTSA